MTEKIVVLCTCASAEEAERLARELVGARLAACVNILPGVRSFYRWQGKLEDAVEHLLLIKSSRDRFDELRAAIERLHSYDVPEVVAHAIVDGAPNYLDWLQKNLENE